MEGIEPIRSFAPNKRSEAGLALSLVVSPEITAVAIDGIEPSRADIGLRVQSCGRCASTDCVGESYEDWYPWRDLHPRRRLEKPLDSLLSDTDVNGKGHPGRNR